MIEVIAKNVESIITTLNVKGGYGNNDFVNQGPAEVDIAEFVKQIKIPSVDRQDENGHLMQAAEYDARIEMIRNVFWERRQESGERRVQRRHLRLRARQPSLLQGGGGEAR
ncbi:hypothetical protein PV735_31910 [Streptomyces turgidiscabies]|uniref:Uncharacterized protein n=1 Tax=Streptomyces turgidiscabies (strain Car8) TaxID=698760 RepID=L7ERF6_STRT8|nr:MULTISPECIES: hypothetical protein [Streptomyces]ELP61484.1 hypothetical protein STRTUCAR8_03680 [Streptomyces turgidiscabies Car8]MDX3497258.1 hypothetical protein [Streptomyces turgidiscabies]GAQ68645.1 hypothetical protein T45_00357 [Streptomyces turgidiscabies]